MRRLEHWQIISVALMLYDFAAVCGAYTWPEDISEEEIVQKLFGLYHELTA